MREGLAAAVLWSLLAWLFFGVAPRLDADPNQAWAMQNNNWAKDCVAEHLSNYETPALRELYDFTRVARPEVDDFSYGDAAGFTFWGPTEKRRLICTSTQRLYASVMN